MTDKINDRISPVEKCGFCGKELISDKEKDDGACCECDFDYYEGQLEDDARERGN